MKRISKQKTTTKRVEGFLKDVFEKTKNKSLIPTEILIKPNGIPLFKVHKISGYFNLKLLIENSIIEEIVLNKEKYCRRIMPDFSDENNELHLLADKLHSQVYEIKRQLAINTESKKLAKTNCEQTEIEFKNDTIVVEKNDNNNSTILDEFKLTIDQLNLEKAGLEQKLEVTNKANIELRKRLSKVTNIFHRKNNAMKNIETAWTNFSEIFITNNEDFWKEKNEKKDKVNN